MADFYLDVSAPGNEYQAYAATPTWGALSTDKPLPMDGNGLAGPGHAAAVAIAEILINALPADTNTLSIAGAVLTAKTAASAKNQFAIGASIAACVTNLVALINTPGTAAAQCDAVVSTSASAAALQLPYWLFARVKPGTTDTVQLATRFAGSTLNQAVNSAVGIAHAGWATAPTFTQFAGGADGPYAYLVSASAAFGKAALSYGIMALASGAPGGPALSGVDPIITRTKRSGSDLSVFLTSGSGISILTPSGASRTFVFDDGTTWAGDSGQLVVTINSTSGGNVSHIFAANTGATLRLVGRSKYAAKILFSCSTAVTVFYDSRFTVASNLFAENVEMGCETPNAIWYPQNGAYAGGTQTFIGCRLLFSRNQSITGVLVNYGLSTRILESDLVFSAGSDISQLLGTSATVGSAASNLIDIRNSRFIVDGGLHGVSSLGLTSLPADGRLVVCLDNNDGLARMALGVAGAATNVGAQLYWGDVAEGRSFSYENASVSVDWDGSGVFPWIPGVVTPENAPFAFRTNWRTGLSDARPTPVARLSTVHEDVDAVRTIDVELLAPTAEIPDKSELFAVLRFVGADNSINTMSSRVVRFSAAALDAGIGTGSWSLAGLTGLTSNRIRFTSAIAVKQGTRIDVDLYLCGPASVNRLLYISPELVVT
ncbi:MAG: hypothetical protein KA784_00115 [Aquabacterium sp.]|nr:hypothetical protein [Ottowia sp.]MBP7501169.1 hypothetical protein [Aquabacterium sp.]